MRAWRQLCLDRQTLQYKQMIALKYAEIVYNGQWFTPLREALGTVRCRHAAERDGHGSPQALQGECHAGGPAGALQPVPRGLCYFWRV